jgi:hypothetical protein
MILVATTKERRLQQVSSWKVIMTIWAEGGAKLLWN